MSGDSYLNIARGFKITAVFYLVLIAASLVLVHSPSYEPGVSYILLYLSAIVLVTACIALIMLPPEQFSEGFGIGASIFLTAFLALITFFSGGYSSELYLLYLPILISVAFHGSWKVGITSVAGSLFFYGLAVLPGLLNEGIETGEMGPVTFYRFGILLMVGVLGLFTVSGSISDRSRRGEDDHEEEVEAEELLRRADREIQARRGVPVAVVLVDPGRDVKDVDSLLEKVAARISPPVLLGEENVFGFVVSGVGDREVEGAARRALATASSLGSTEMRAGAAIYPRDARSANDLLSAAGHALEAAFDVDSPSAIVLSARGAAPNERRYRAAR